MRVFPVCRQAGCVTFENYKIRHMKSILKYILFFWFAFILNLFSYSQTYNWQAKVESVENAGYYKMFLNSDVTSHLHHAFPDIRLYDDKNNEIQYILSQNKTIYDKGKRTELKILKNKYRKFKHFTEVIVENTGNIEISNLIFKVVNTNNPVFIKIMGSSDTQKWYILKNNYPTVPDITNADTTEIKVMNLPRSDFKYIKILFHDYDEQNIEVIKVYYHDLADIRAEYTQLPKPEIIQKDTLDKSIVTVEFKEAQFIDMFTFGIQGPEFYLRKVQMMKDDTGIVATPGEEFYDQMKKDFWLGSLKSNRINLADYKAKKVVFIIDNKDNQPLKVFKVNAYQLKNYMITYLLPDTKYHLLYGSKNANFPSYDLPYFKDTIPKILPETYIYNIKRKANAGTEINTIWNFPVQYLWFSIGILAIILIVISILLLKRTVKKNKNQE